MLRRDVHWDGIDAPAITFEGANLNQPYWLHADERGSIVASDNANGLPTINNNDEYAISGAGHRPEAQEPGPGQGTGLGCSAPLCPARRSTAGAFCMFRALYDWTLRMAGHRHAIRYMAAVSFAESSFFPIPPDVMLVPMVLARRDQAWLIATVCTIASVLGGIAGYAIGYFLYDSVGQWLMRVYGMADGIEEFRLWYAEWGAAIILVKGLTPVPFKLVTIASGFAAFNFPLFVLCALVTRGARFFLIAALLQRYGAPVHAFIERRTKLVGWGFLAVVVSGFGVVTLL